MAEEVQHGEFWLPPEFLTDEDIITDFKPKPCLTRETDSVLHFPEWGCFNSFGTNSGLDSPVDESIGSEEEEEDYLAGLTQKMANSSFLDDLWKSDSHKSWGMSVSPQSTLTGFKQQGSSRGSPNCPSPPTGADRVDVGWELLYAAAGEVARMRMIDEANNACFHNRGLNPVSYSENIGNFGYQLNQSVTYQQMQLAKFQQLRREQLIRQQQQRHALQVAQAKARTSDRQPANLTTMNWPTLHQSFQPQSQQQPATAGSGMRAVFLGNTGPKRESAGTGVFIPRRAGTEPPRKTSGCSTVLLPDRVVQALNLNLEAMDAHSRLNNSLTSDLGGAAVNMRNNVIMAQQQRMNIRPQVALSDLRLPQEWTY